MSKPAESDYYDCALNGNSHEVCGFSSFPSPSYIHNKTSGYAEDLLEPLQENLLTFNSPESGWEWYPTSEGYVEAPLEWLLFGGPLNAPLSTPLRITRKISGPLACPSGGRLLELTWEENDPRLEDVYETPNEISNFFIDVSLGHDNLPVRHPYETEHRKRDYSPTAASFCLLTKSEAAEKPKQIRVSYRSSVITGH